MRKLKRYKNGDEYIVGGIASLEPNGNNPVSEYDLSNFTDEEFKQFMKNKKDKNLLKKMRKING